MYPPIPPRFSSSSSVDTSPLLGSSIADHIARTRGILPRSPQPLRGAAARLLRRASSRRMMLREPSVRVRETAAEQLEERQSDWSYSKPITVLDIFWNLAFVGISAAVLGLSVLENPSVPLRVWIVGYALQCLFHVGCVIFEFKRRREGRNAGSEGNSVLVSDSASGSFVESDNSEDYDVEEETSDDESSVAKILETANTMFSFIWWVVGFYWVTVDSNTLTYDSPQLYWLCVTFLAFDVVFVVICVAIASLIGIAVCCCLPCIIAILYAVADREGASEEAIDKLPKYKFRRVGDFETIDGDFQESNAGIMTQCGPDTPVERLLSHDDAECCICLCVYDDENELRELPCNHHFHCSCIDKWLLINATCPLCKFDILKAENQSYSEEV